jgi:hypothetical protein
LSDRGEGRLKKSGGKEKRLVICAMINERGVDKQTVNIFPCNDDHSMNSYHFKNRQEDSAGMNRISSKQAAKKEKIRG